MRPQPLTSIKDMFDPRNMPEFKRTEPTDIPVPNLDPMEVMQTQSLTV